jgi:hypothetical protein
MHCHWGQTTAACSRNHLLRSFPGRKIIATLRCNRTRCKAHPSRPSSHHTSPFRAGRVTQVSGLGGVDGGGLRSRALSSRLVCSLRSRRAAEPRYWQLSAPRQRDDRRPGVSNRAQKHYQPTASTGAAVAQRTHSAQPIKANPAHAPFTPSRGTRQLRYEQCSVGAAGLEDGHQGPATSDYVVMGVWLQVVLAVYLVWRPL